MTGLSRGTVKLEPYDPAWPQEFAKEAERLKAGLGIAAERIQHVGSTSIPGMVAKPIIDIAILVDDLGVAEQWQKVLSELGYWYKGLQPDMPHRHFFAKGPEVARTVYLHVVDSSEYKRLVSFRDELIAHKKLASRYIALKQQLASTYAHSRVDYSAAKNDFIQKVLKDPRAIRQ